MIEYLVNGERNTQLFNLADDPIEFNNLSGNEEFDLKLIEYFVDGERNTQLFNLKDDPVEFNNLFGNKEFDLKYDEMKEEMIQQMKEMNDTNLFYKEMIIN